MHVAKEFYTVHLCLANSFTKTFVSLPLLPEQFVSNSVTGDEKNRHQLLVNCLQWVLLFFP